MVIKDSTENEVLNQHFALGINIILLCVHIFFLVIFFILKIYLLVFVNIGSITLYVSLFGTIRKNPVKFIFRTYLEVLFHMTFATLCLGWDCGFQLHCFALIPVIFYCDYLNKKTNSKSVPPIFISVAVSICYFLLRLYTYHLKPFYSLNQENTFLVLYLLNTAMVLAFIIVYMAAYEKLSVRSESKLLEAATKDTLTQISNRRNMLKFMDSAFQDCVIRNHEMAVSILDIDDFKRVNDRFGHNAGDFILRELASEIRIYEKQGDVMVCRWGGEEFVLMMTGSHSYSLLKEKMEQLVLTISQKTFRFGEITIPITITAGIAKYRKDATIDALIARADQYLYEGKNNGKNQLVSKD